MRRFVSCLPHFLAGSALFLSTHAFSWGAKGHETVNMAAVNLCQSPIKKLFAANAERVGQLSVVPDSMWKKPETIKQERPAHFFQWDEYKDSVLVDRFPIAYRAAKDLVGADFVERNGTAVWRVESFYRELVQSLKDKKWEDAIATASVLGHYVADLSQPMHATADYDGQSINRPGIHRDFETVLLNGSNRGDLVKEVTDRATAIKGSIQVSTGNGQRISIIGLNVDEARVSLDALPAVLDEYRDGQPDQAKLLEMAKKHMARGAATLAIIWDMAATDAGLKSDTVPGTAYNVTAPKWRPIQ